MAICFASFKCASQFLVSTKMSENVKNVNFYIILDSKANKQGIHKVYVRFLQGRKCRANIHTKPKPMITR